MLRWARDCAEIVKADRAFELVRRLVILYQLCSCSCSPWDDLCVLKQKAEYSRTLLHMIRGYDMHCNMSHYRQQMQMAHSNSDLLQVDCQMQRPNLSLKTNRRESLNLNPHPSYSCFLWDDLRVLRQEDVEYSQTLPQTVRSYDIHYNETNYLQIQMAQLRIPSRAKLANPGLRTIHRPCCLC